MAEFTHIRCLAGYFLPRIRPDPFEFQRAFFVGDNPFDGPNRPKRPALRFGKAG